MEGASLAGGGFGSRALTRHPSRSDISAALVVFPIRVPSLYCRGVENRQVRADIAAEIGHRAHKDFAVYPPKVGQACQAKMTARASSGHCSHRPIGRYALTMSVQARRARFPQAGASDW
jgi:hypothetical protein